MNKTSLETEQKQLATDCINTVRCLAMDAVEKAKSGHPGTPMELAPIAYVLWMKHLRHNPSNPLWANRDRFVLSAGHACMLLYSMLHLTGYKLSMDDIKKFRQWGSITPGHSEHELTPGVEATTGPLGQGIGNVVGMAIAERYLASYFNRPGHDIVDHTTYAICSDGDIMEGVGQESASLAGHLGLHKLILIYSANQITIDGPANLAFSEDVGKRFQAYGWFVQHIDGNDLDAIDRALTETKGQSAQPSIIVARTHIAYGSPNKQDHCDAHGSPLGKEEVRLTKKNLGWDPDKEFFVPQEVYTKYGEAVPRGEALELEWDKRFAAYARAFPQLAKEFHDNLKELLPSGWEKDLPIFAPDPKGIGTRRASGKLVQSLAQRLPNMIGGSADLTGSCNTYIESSKDFGKGAYGNRNLRFGVREHAMGAILNGMAYHGGVRPFGSTFLIFSDYMRPSIRLAALVGLPVIYVFTHDSIGLGEDGPTHQPIEHLPSLRAIPNLLVIRPCDANEVTEAWKVAIAHHGGPTALIMTRQNVPILDRKNLGAAAGLTKGAYVLSEESGKIGPELILIATGSEVHPTLEAQQLLEKKKIPTRVVSMPSWELFGEQPKSYQEKVLPPKITPRLAVEAASPMGGWERWIGTRGAVLGIHRFGASAPAEVVLEKFGFTGKNIAAQALKLLKK